MPQNQHLKTAAALELLSGSKWCRCEGPICAMPCSKVGPQEILAMFSPWFPTQRSHCMAVSTSTCLNLPLSKVVGVFV